MAQVLLHVFCLIEKIEPGIDATYISSELATKMLFNDDQGLKNAGCGRAAPW
jgi:hypothetical protein